MSHALQSEEATRVALAACYRLAAHFQMTDLIYTHITAKVPGTEGQFLINPYGRRWEEITASSLVKIDTDGQKLRIQPPLSIRQGLRFIALFTMLAPMRIGSCIHIQRRE